MKNIPIALLLFFVLALSACEKQFVPVQNSDEAKVPAKVLKQNNQTNEYPMSSSDIIVEKLEVYYFHRNARCSSCKTIGKYTKETMKQNYSEQIEAGLIDYREINIDIPGNKEIAMKFQASGSSLFTNRIIEGEDNILQDANVWRLLGDEEKIKAYLKTTINSSLGI